MDKIEQTFTRLREDKEELSYPDFDAMWKRIGPELPAQGAPLLSPAQAVPGRRRVRKWAVLSALTAILIASPVVAAVTMNWEPLLEHRRGITSALQQGLGQRIEQSQTRGGYKLTVETAVVDDDRTMLLFQLIPDSGAFEDEDLYFSRTELQDSRGKTIEGYDAMQWDPESRSWRGYFETDWAPESLIEEVRFIAQGLNHYSRVARELDLQPFSGQAQSFDIGEDGMDRLTVQPFEQGERVLLASTITAEQPDAVRKIAPMLIVTKDGDVPVPHAPEARFGAPGPNGEYTANQYFQIRDLQEGTMKYQLSYTKIEPRMNESFEFQLKLDKQQMLSGTLKRELNIPVEHAGFRMTLSEMVITPTQIRLKARHEKYKRVPFLNYQLQVGDKVLEGLLLHSLESNPEESIFRFERPTGIQLTEQTPVSLIARHEVLEHKDATEGIRLRQISEQKQSFTTQVGKFQVKWTYYRQNGNLYVESEGEDPSFGGINQTFMEQPDRHGDPVNNFRGDGTNKAIDVYEGYEGSEAEIFIYWYYTEDPTRELRIEVPDGQEPPQQR